MATHIIENTDGLQTWVGPRIIPEDDFAAPMRQFDGQERRHMILMRLVVPGIPGDLTDKQEEESNETFIQAAGSASALTVEMRRREGSGFVQYVVGMPTKAPPSKPTVPIEVGEYTYYVAPNEVFDADSAAALFGFYAQHDTVPDNYSLRVLERDVD